MKLSRRQNLTLTVWYWLAGALRVKRRVRDGIAWSLGFPLMAGGAPGEGEGGGSGGEGGGGGEGAGGGAGGGGEGGGSGGGSFTPPDERTWNGTQQSLRETREENERLKADAEKRQREDAERERKANEEAGNHQANATAAEQRAEAAEKAAEDARTEAANVKLERQVEKIAGRLNFRDPGDVMHLLSDKDKADDDAIEKRLKTVATERPYLTAAPEGGHTREANGGDGGGEGSGGVEPTGQDRLARAYAQGASGKP